MKQIVIDTHSHVGKDIFHGDATLDGYIDYAQQVGLMAGLLMPVPSPCIDLKNPDTRYMYWKLVDDSMKYYGERNPFKIVNYDLVKQIQEANQNVVELYFVPTIHPILDDEYYLEELFERSTTVAVKIHGIGSGVGPGDIPKHIIELIRKWNLPVIVHTDCDNGLGSKSMQYVRNINQAYNWGQFFIENGIKGILNHGASLDTRAFELVNKSELLRLAIGPEAISCKDSNRLFVDCHGDSETYFRILKEYVDVQKLLFDIDYNWNMPEEKTQDYEPINRVKAIWTNPEDSDKILYKNALGFIDKVNDDMIKRKVLERRGR